MKIKTTAYIKFLVFFFFAYNIGFSQKASRHFVDSSLLANDSNFNLTKNLIYVINGIPRDTADLDSILSKYQTKHLLDAVYWDGKKQGHYPFYGDVAIIKFAYNQKTKQKRKMWNAVKNLFNDKSIIPVLTIDKYVVDSLNSKKAFQTLRLRDIMYIDKSKLADQYHIRIWKVN